MVGRLVKKAVGVNSVVVDAALRNSFGLELGVGGEIAPIVVAEMVVRDDGQRPNTGVDQELSKDRLEFGLTGHETVASDKRPFVCRSSALYRK